ncbi:MAG TPA: hypothetical protein VFL85_04315 [Candidatus Saccharimonadales bacterium]|nr:hypothetical protein [Candidatus Saccharimonadales bacterium]
MQTLAFRPPVQLSKLTPMNWFAVLVSLACVLALALPPDPHTLRQLHISRFEYRLAILSLLIPYIICWYAGFYVYAKLIEYTKYLKSSHEGAAFMKTTKGMGILAFGLILPTIINLILGQVAQRYTGTRYAVTIINNYIAIIFPLAALVYISGGGRLLVGLTKTRPKFGGIQIFAAVYILLSIFYTFLVSFNYYRYHNPYHVPLIVLILTFVGPYLYLWFLGLMSAYDFKFYSINVKGVLYKRALNLFASGIALMIAGSIISQFINGSYGARQSSIGTVLLLNYAFLVVIAAGLVMMAAGANKLKRIEEV